ncbi:asparagine synthase (glutamine-hydrolyzing) [Pedobacter sp. WC2423]|uniref:asparagine synthase (glutamine-hydrolyzing) n=1 Tax=Pedobacter sp. WC2423 TaxID=3234142 RepID=UPI003467AD9C
MCGICGFVKFNQNVSQEDESIVHGMNNKLRHRGPDAQEVLLYENIAFGFSRLSIIGLENGMQPMSNEDNSLILICNGEIFNYLELKEELKKSGHSFKTDTDVEVILHLYEDYGPDFLNKLNGQFAFALYDKKRKRLFCVRDQMGIIPFFYTFTQNTFIFGSEIKSILEHPLVVREVDMVGLDQVLTFSGLISPRTMFKNIHSLENGHFLIVDEYGNIKKQEYWDLIYPEGENVPDEKPEKYYIEKLEELLDKSIGLRLRADVPSGLYLSGGLDSSMITMKVKQLQPDVCKEVFSIDFPDSNLSESVYQNIVATASNAKLNKKTFFSEDISERLRHSVYHSECPIKETYNTASLSLSESVRAKDIKVILSGEGADELFAGYVGYRFDKMRALNMVANTANAEEEKLRERLWGDKTFFYERNYGEFNEVKKRLYSKHINSSFDEIDCLNHPLVNLDRLKNRNVLNKRAYIDYKLRLVDHLISDHGDRMAMANSIEVRYPFLDINLVEFSTQVPAELKLKDLNEKYILKKIAEKFVPKQVVDREKFGFIAPGSPYLIKRNIEFINDTLSSDSIRKQGYFNHTEIEQLKNKYGQKDFAINIPFESDLLITVITFGLFLEEYF